MKCLAHYVANYSPTTTNVKEIILIENYSCYSFDSLNYFPIYFHSEMPQNLKTKMTGEELSTNSTWKGGF